MKASADGLIAFSSRIIHQLAEAGIDINITGTHMQKPRGDLLVVDQASKGRRYQTFQNSVELFAPIVTRGLDALVLETLAQATS